MWDASLDWTAFDVVVIRSCWDYHRRHDEFLAWIARLENARVAVVNSPSLIRWNSHKSYLEELAAASIPVVPTIAVDRRGLAGALARARERGWRNVVVKPAVSASAEGVIALTLENVKPHGLDRLPPGDYLVQPFLDTLETVGEIDVIYLGGEYSHAVRRSHAAGDWAKLVEIQPSVATAAAVVFNALPEPPVYCRVDLVMHDEQPMLMEVELIEPDLFLKLAPGAAERFANAVVARGR